jgi:predicted O-methyltransferase YrrM
LISSNGKGHGTHSPFVFHFISTLLNDPAHYPEYDKVETLKQELINDKTILSVEDPGAGSGFTRSSQRSIASIAKNAGKSQKYGRLLFRIVRGYQPNTILELGTSLGISTAYMSLAKPDARLITMEGVPSIAAEAVKNIRKLELRNCTLVEGNFDNELQHIIDNTVSIDLAFIDGNHRQEPVERYFQQLKKKVNNDSILVFDDIHWSRGMEMAWDHIKSDPGVTCSIDLFFFGLVFFRDEFREKQDFIIRF